MIDGERFVTQPGGEYGAPGRAHRMAKLPPRSAGHKEARYRAAETTRLQGGQAVSGTDTQAVGVTHDVVQDIAVRIHAPFGRPVEPEV